MSSKPGISVRWPQRLAWLVAAANLALFAGAVLISYLRLPQPTALHWGAWGGGVFIDVIQFSPYMIIGLLIIFRQPGNRYGWIPLFSAFFIGGWLIFFDSLGGYINASGGGIRLVALCAHLAGVGWISLVALLVYAVLWFPTGDYPSPRWRFVGWLTLIAMTVVLITVPLRPGPMAFSAQIGNPFAAPGSLGVVMGAIADSAVGIMFAALLLGIVSVVIRYLRSAGVERQQIKWFAFAALLLAFGLIVDNATELAGNWERLKEALLFSLLPLAIGIAILRYRLWDIDVIIRRTLIYGALTLTLGLVFFGGVTLLQQLFGAVTGTAESPAAIVISTLLIAALIAPLRRRIQRDIDRRFFRQKYNAEQTLAAFAATARDEVELEKLAEALLDTVQETVQPEQVSIWLKPVQRGSPGQYMPDSGEPR